MEDCIGKCCQHRRCDLAMMLKDICYTVVCTNDKLCEKKHTSLSNGFSPKIAYVFKEEVSAKEEDGSDTGDDIFIFSVFE